MIGIYLLLEDIYVIVAARKYCDDVSGLSKIDCAARSPIVPPEAIPPDTVN